MKRLIAICLLLMMIVVSASADWENGLSPAKPYSNVPEVDLTEKIGHMLFFPNVRMNAAGSKQLLIYLPREDVKGGPGYLHVRTADQGEEWSVALNNKEYVTQWTLTEGELNGLKWGGGTCIAITLPVSLRLGTTYYIDLDTHCVIDEDEKIGNLEAKGDLQWHFETDSDYGVSQAEYRRLTDKGDYETTVKPAEGDEIRFDLVLGGAAKSAVVTADKNAEFLVENFNESTEVVGEITGEDPAWYVLFFDENGEMLSVVEF